MYEENLIEYFVTQKSQIVKQTHAHALIIMLLLMMMMINHCRKASIDKIFFSGKSKDKLMKNVFRETEKTAN